MDIFCKFLFLVFNPRGEYSKIILSSFRNDYKNCSERILLRNHPKLLQSRNLVYNIFYRKFDAK